ncbi:MAG: septum formation initiator family protein [Candidatus Cloacimonas sp.]|nr:septum formation initiator family protein [Candidatus Cloacimonadota bacterium]
MITISKRQERMQRRKKLLDYLYWGIIIFFILSTLFFARYNLITFITTRRTNKLHKEELSALKIENKELKEHIKELKDNPEEWERIAREKHNMLKKNEEMILFKESD